jgi:hypothetical protein
MISKLGERFPNEPTWVAAPTSPRDLVAATPAMAGPSEIVGKHKSA